jgi:hypothetical protein
MTTRRAPLVLVLAVLAIAPACQKTRASTTVVERMGIDLVVQSDGAVSVTEHVKTRTVGAPETFERRLMPRADAMRVDRFSAVRPTLVPGSDTPPTRTLIDIRGDGGAHVRWPEIPADVLPLTSYRLAYRAEGALELIGTRAWLRWRLAPLRPPYPIAAMTVTLRVPPGVRLVEEPAIAGEGWTVTHNPGGMQAAHGALTADGDAVLTAVLDVGALTLLEPEWQRNADRAGEMAPAFLSGALCIIVVGLGAIVMVRVQYMKNRAMSALMSPGDAGRGLMVTGLVVLVLGAATAAGMPFVIERYGTAIATIPASLILVAVLMIAAGARLRRRHTGTRHIDNLHSTIENR